ncbi:MAG: GTPase ObgE [Acidimicrobiales bacterium]
MTGFVDEAQIHAKAGDGGAGAVSFRREAHVSRGGPDGGDGGKGGDVYLEASSGIASLLSFQDHPHRRATKGTHGEGGKRSGKAGSDLVAPVPVGTIVRTREGSLIADLAREGDRVLVASGGRGGHGNARFLSNRRRAPAFAEQGEFGEERWLNLELKLLADVALVGFPNAGKSTLVSRISAARPKIAAYPFTTLEPHLGVVRFPDAAPDELAEFVVADIPGLVEGASEGRGLGHKFLRHVERARVLVVLVDLGPDEGRAPDRQIETLLTELERFEPTLVSRPRIVVGSRSDLLSKDDRPPLSSYGGELECSAVTGEGIEELLERLRLLVDEARRETAIPVRERVVHRPLPEGVVVEREGGGFVVAGRAAERAVALSDLTDPDALSLVQRRLRRLGVDRALARAGAKVGDDVRIGGLTFTYREDEG